MVVTPTHTCKDQGQRSVGSKDRLKTDGHADGGDCIITRANAVGKYAQSYGHAGPLRAYHTVYTHSER